MKTRRALFLTIRHHLKYNNRASPVGNGVLNVTNSVRAVLLSKGAVDVLFMLCQKRLFNKSCKIY
jgi:hypothetical protein